MADIKPPEFRFSADDQESDEFYQEELKDMRVEKLSQRLTLISILLPCLIAVVIFLGYRDLTNRVNKGRDSENLEVQKLSTQMEGLSAQIDEKLKTVSKTLSSQDQKFSNSISGKLNTLASNIEVLKKNMASVSEDLKQAQDAIEKLDGAKADKNSQTVAFDELREDLDPLKDEIQSLPDLRTDLESASSEIKNLENQITEEMTKVAADAATLKKEYDQLQASITEQLGEKIDKAALGVELLMFKKNQNTHSQEIERLTRQLESIQQKLAGAQLDSDSTSQPGESIPDTSPAAPSTRDEISGANENDSSPNTEDTNLEEQDLPPE